MMLAEYMPPTWSIVIWAIVKPALPIMMFTAMVFGVVLLACKILGIGQSGVSIAVGVTSDDSAEGSDTPAKPVFVVMTTHQDVAEFEQIKQLMAAGGYNASNVIEGKLATKDGASNG